MARLPRVVKYVDMPLQHGSERILRLMKRPAATEKVLERLTDNQKLIAVMTGATPADSGKHFDWAGKEGLP